MIAPKRHQRGMTLLVGLVMLVLLLLMAVSAFNISNTTTAVTGNMQAKMQTTNAAEQAIEQAISSTQFTQTPGKSIPDSCADNQACIDVNGDGTKDVTVVLKPQPCIKKIQIIKTANLNLNDPEDVSCMRGATDTAGIEGATTGNSMCAESVWEITAEATDLVTQSKSTIVTGVGTRVPSEYALDTSKACK